MNLSLHGRIGLPATFRPVPLRRTPGPAAPVSPVPVAPATADPLLAAIDWAHYVDGERQPGSDFARACRAAASGNGFVWLGLFEPSAAQLDGLRDVFGLHPLALEDAGNSRQRPKLERYEDGALFLSLRTLGYVDSHVRGEGGEIVQTGTATVLVGDWYALTVRHGRHAPLQPVRLSLEARPEQLARGPIAVVHGVIDSVVDDYLRVADEVAEDVEEIESHVFATGGTPQVERIYQLKRDLIEMKRTVAPLLGPLRKLAEAQGDGEMRQYFLDVHDHLEQVREQVGSYDELMSSILQAAVARLSVSENEDMRKISAWVAIAAVPTMVAGIYGMNFDFMPELTSPWGYPAVLLGMGTVCLLLYRNFRRQRWL
ncbi:MAG: magnesium and cobalt transport protein CorA [Propionibacteriaceae bacterium]|jgi:magnesium transporter|nr:magnesium and cobalt transport protein CorA [Propionibacteriaceae bacterium]